MSLDGRVAVVTGATKGVGRGIGRELAQHGARVFVTGRSAPDHERLDKQVTGIRCDHRVDTQVEAAFNLIVREADAIDILVNNVWGGYERMIEDGALLVAAGLAMEYGFTDVDGKTPRPLTLTDV